MSRLLADTMSFGAMPASTAVARCASVSDSTTARPASSSGASTRRPFARAVLDLGGIGAGEERRGRHDAAIADGEVQRQVMALDPPAPQAARPRRAEHRELIVERRAREARAALDGAQHVFEADDGGGGEIALLAEPGLEQGVGLVLLRRRHGAERQPLAGEHLVGDEVPVQALVRRVVEDGLRALVGRERRDQDRWRPRPCGPRTARWPRRLAHAALTTMATATPARIDDAVAAWLLSRSVVLTCAPSRGRSTRT